MRAACTALIVLGVSMAGARAVAQDPTPIPNWTPTQSTSDNGQYAQGQQSDGSNPQYGYGSQQPAQQYGQPQYQQPPQYGEQSAPLNNQQQAYGEPSPYDAPDQGYNPPYQPQQAISPDRLEQMVAPIALYPDNLVSIVLAASTYPAQIVAANQWLHALGGASPDQIAAQVNSQTSWDPSVKALTGFPQVLDTMAQNLQWTTDLGNAYYNQPQDVMQTIQVMRGRAQTAGNLQDAPQQVVVQDQGAIAIAPPTPEVVYVPQYDPWVVYGQPLAPYPGFNWFGGVGYAGNAFVSWGPGIALGAFAVTPFGWLGWGLSWTANAIFFGNSIWCTHSHSVRDWGFAHGGGRYWGAHGEMARFQARGGWGNQGGWNQAFRSGLDRNRFASGNSGPRGVNGGGNNYGHNGYGMPRGGSYSGGGAEGHNPNGRGNGFGYGANNGAQNSGAWARNGNGQNIPRGGSYTNGPQGRLQNGGGSGYSAGNRGGYGQGGTYGQQGSQGFSRGPQPTGGPQQYRGSQQYAPGQQRSYAGGSYGYPAPQHVYGGGSAGSSIYSHPLQNYGMRPGFSGSNAQPYRPAGNPYGSSTNAYGGRSYSYGGSNVYGGARTFGGSSIARAPSVGGFGSYGGSSGGSYRAPRAPSYSSHSFGGGGGFSAPHISSGGGRSFSGGGGGHSFGGGGGHSGGGGGHSGGGGHGGGHR